MFMPGDHSAFGGEPKMCCHGPRYEVGSTLRPEETKMKRIILALIISSFAAGSAMAASCEASAMSKDGKPLAGAAKSAFVKKCKSDACEGKAMSKEGKPLAGAAKDSFMKKCEADA
jgi:hypothetical protein